MIYLIHFDHKTIHHIMSNKFEMGMSNPILNNETTKNIPVCNIRFMTRLEIIETDDLMT